MASAVLRVICGRCSARKCKTKLPRICFSAILEFVTDFCKTEPLWAELCNFFGDVSTFDILRNVLDDFHFCRCLPHRNRWYFLSWNHFRQQNSREETLRTTTKNARKKNTNQTTKNNTRKKRIRPPKTWEQTQFRPQKKQERHHTYPTLIIQ